MKITEVHVYNLSYPVNKPYSNSSGTNRARQATFVEVKTDAGLTGWGEGSGPPSQGDIEKFVIGRSPFDYEVIYDDLSHGGRSCNTACGVEIALWDLMGRALDKPVWQLLGGKRRDKVLAYASGLFRLQGEDHASSLADEAKRYRDLGFKAVKMKTGFGPDQDEVIVSSVREAIGPDLSLAIDANCGYDPSASVETGNRLKPYNLLWYEEPIVPQDVRGYGIIKQAIPTVRLAGAEALVGAQAFRDLIQARVLDVIQPDISIAGGFVEMKRISAMASADHVRVIPHMWGGNVRLAATLQFQATMPDTTSATNAFPCYCEYDMTENGLRTELGSQYPMEDGWVAIPDGPGLSVEVDREALSRYAI